MEKRCPPHDWKDDGKLLVGTPVRKCRKCGRVEYFWSKIIGSLPRWQLRPPL